MPEVYSLSIVVSGVRCTCVLQRAVYSCASVAWWAGAAAHQAGARATLQRAAHLDLELRALLHDYFCERAALDTMLTDMLVQNPSTHYLINTGSHYHYLHGKDYIKRIKFQPHMASVLEVF